MNFIQNKTFTYFFLFSIITILFAYRKPNEVFDLNFHDPYYVIKNSHLGVLLFIIYFVLGSIHFYINKSELQLNKFIIYSHTFITISGSVLVWILIRYVNSFSSTNIEDILKSVKINQYVTYLILFIVTIIFLSQLIFINTFIYKMLKRLL